MALSSPRPSRLAAASLAALALAAASCGGGGTPAPAVDTCDPAFVGSAAGVQCFKPSAFAGTNTLTVQVPSLAADEQVALLLVNAGGTGGLNPIVTVSGTGSAPARVQSDRTSLPLAAAPLAPEATGRAEARAGHEALRRAEAEYLASAPPAARSLSAAPAALPAARAAQVGDAGSFCHLQVQVVTNPTTQRKEEQQVYARHAAHLRHQTASAQFWVTDDVWAAFQSAVAPRGLTNFWDSLAAAYDVRVRPALDTYYGPESDFDGNGQMIFLFGNLGAGLAGFPVGYFTTRDLRNRDDSALCNGPNTSVTAPASNGGDFLYLTDPATFTSHGFGLDQITDTEYPGTMAHELQHNVNWNVRCRLAGRTCSGGSDDAWVNEGLSMLSEDLAGFGLNDPDPLGAEYERVGTYLRIYADFSMTFWEGDPDANYGGAHAFMRYWMDQHGGATTFTRALLDPSRRGAANVANATGVPFESSLIRFAMAALFSGEPVSPLPDLDFDPTANWSPLHQKVFFQATVGGTTTKRSGYVRYTPLPITGSIYPQLREDGWSAFLTGKGSGGNATLSITTTAPRKPHVVVVRFAGDLPR